MKMANDVLRSQNLSLLAQLQQGQSQCKSMLSSLGHSSLSTDQSLGSRLKAIPSSSYQHTTRTYPSLTSHASRDMRSHYMPVGSTSLPGKMNSGKTLEMGILSNVLQSEECKSPSSDGSQGYFSKDMCPKRTDHTTTSTDAYSRYFSELKGNYEIPTLNVSFSEEPDVCSQEGTMTSTPTKPTKSQQETPKSILKRRKIIDDNVYVESKYNHTPFTARTPRNPGLNFSYSQADDLDGSYSTQASTYSSQVQDRTAKVIDDVERDFLLKDSGNDRRNAAIVKQLSERPKSFVFDTTTAVERSKPPTSSSRDQSLINNRTSTMSSMLRARSQMEPQDGKRPLLGYDWIAGVLDNEALTMDQSDQFFDDLKEFRRVNRDDCEGQRAVDLILDTAAPIMPQVTQPSHTCVHGYTINERLFPEAMNPSEDGTSVCPVCLAERREPTKEEPGFIRVSIPRSTLVSPYRIQPHRRRSFDETDSYALSRHCLAGWESSQPSQIPSASTVDLRQSSQGLTGKLSKTKEEMEQLAGSYSRQSRNLGTNLLEQTRDRLNRTIEQLNRTQLDTTANSGMERSTMRPTSEDLLSQAHNFRFSQQRFERDRELNGGKAAVYSLI